MSRRIFDLTLLLSLAACGGNDAPKPEMAPAVPHAEAQQNAPSESKAKPIAAEAKPELTLRVLPMGNGLGLRVINAGSEKVSLAAQVWLEGKDGAQSKPSGLTLQKTCQSQGCVTLIPGAEIDAPAWLEQVSGERCGNLLVPKENGDLTLRVQTCGGTHSVRVTVPWPMQ